MTERGALLGGRYMLDQIIGRGGMAEVWRARDTRLERDVAVKRLRVDLASDATFQARFRREAQSAAGLNHPNIVAVYDTGEERDAISNVSVPYIVMELVEGVTLREVLRDGRKILPERALEFTAGVLDALAYSHRAGIIHRDIKPANVMLTPNGTVKVMDFGIARAVADTSATMTQTAAVIGTAQYLSPEQARGEKVDNRSDIYSVGCLLYELLTGEPLFKGDSPVSVAYQHVREAPVPPSQLDPEITPSMDAVVLKSLSKDPRDRYQDASEFREDVLRAMRGQPVHAAAPSATAVTSVIPNEPMTTTARRAAGATTVAQASDLLPGENPEGAGEAEEEQKKSRKGLIALLVVAALVLIAIGIGVFQIMNPGTPAPSQSQVAMVDVPNVVGQNEAAAISMIQDAGLKEKVEYVTGTEGDKGQVVEQAPKKSDGQVEAGSTITIKVSQGPEAKEIPSGIENVPYDTAKQLLEATGFTNIDRAYANPETEPIDAVAGNVISSDPSAGTSVSLDTKITLTVATGKSIVPDLMKLSESEAVQKAKEAGFDNVKVKTETGAAGDVGKVTSQAPEAGTKYARSKTITITVATAPSPSPDPTTTSPSVSESTSVKVPDLVGKPEDTARAEAESAGFSFEVEEVDAPTATPGTVVSQNPVANSSASPGSTITVQVAKDS